MLLDWFRRKTELEKLKERYSRLMKKSYHTALYNKQKSDEINREARQLYSKIKKLSKAS